ncbi:MAG: HPF/RaiA family ribosome-associated protein [Desulfobulbaceae bacterium]|nr:HPF/RaiA family ribosome-associated protein [Desulfobulbaceae bacterium]
MELQVEGRNVEIRKSWQEKIEEEKVRLDRHHPGLVLNLRVTIAGTAHHKEGGHELQLVAAVPNDTVVVKRKGENVKALLCDAFDTMGLQLKELQRKRRQSVKIVDAAQDGAVVEGVVKKLMPHESYGFIAGPDGREVYFHENALKDLKMDQLTEGDLVKFCESDGDKGPCASWVRSV